MYNLRYDKLRRLTHYNIDCPTEGMETKEKDVERKIIEG